MSIDPAALEILCYPAPSLRARGESIETIDDDVRSVAQRMIELALAAHGAGLAATQVGLPWRMFVTVDWTEEASSTEVWINPVLKVEGREIVHDEEGCLSLPEIRVQVRRAAAVTMSATKLDSSVVEVVAEGMQARLWQHEVDHLDGVLIIDRMTSMDRLTTRKTLRFLERNAGVVKG